METIPLARPDLGADEEAEVLAVLRSGQLALGTRGPSFEALLAEYTAAPWASAVSSGTAGLHLAIRALGIGPGDCVATVSFSFIASANAVTYEGALPVFLDIEAGTNGMDPRALKAYLDACGGGDGLRDPATGRRVAAVLPVHAFGHPCDLDAICALAAEHGLPVIEDACEALGSWYRDGSGAWTHAGTTGEFGVFAFYPNKTITTGEGGAVIGRDPAMGELVASLRNQGRSPDAAWLHHDHLGFNYRMDELSAALGLVQMRRIDEILDRRATVAGWYDEPLSEIGGVRRPVIAEWARPAWFVYAVRVPEEVDRDGAVDALNARGIQSKAYFEPPIHRQPPYADRTELVPFPLPETEAASRDTLLLPFFSTMTREQVERVAETLAGVLAVTRR
jgi:perosamine synthetase